MQLALEIAVPEIEELREVREAGGEIEILPDVGLQEVLVVGHPVEDLGRGDAVVIELSNKTLIHCHSLTRRQFENSYAPRFWFQQNSFHINGLAACMGDCCQFMLRLRDDFAA